MKRSILSVGIAALWISISEFVRNEILLKSFWVDHYQTMGLHFPSTPVNGLIWVIWSISFAVLIFFLSKKFSFMQTVLLVWFCGFVLMWLVIGNLGVLPFGILPYAIPLSLLESILAAFIIRKIV